MASKIFKAKNSSYFSHSYCSNIAAISVLYSENLASSAMYLPLPIGKAGNGMCLKCSIMEAELQGVRANAQLLRTQQRKRPVVSERAWCALGVVP